MSTDWRITSFLKQQVKYAGLYKSVLNKIMTRLKEWIKFNLSAPLTQVTAKEKCLGPSG